MDKDTIMIIANVVIAFSTFAGVFGATAYYMKEIQGLSLKEIFSIEIIYVLATVLLILVIIDNLDGN